MKRVVRQDDGSRTSSAKSPPENRRFLRPPFVTLVVLGGVGAFVAYMLWPTWPNAPIAVDAPAIPITVAGVLFNVPPAAIRAKVLRHPGTHERIDLAFLWPSLTPPPADAKADKPAAKAEQDAAAPPANASDRLFVTIAALGAVLAPAERLRSIYPRYVEAQATAGPDGLAFLPFRAGTPYQGEDLVYLGEQPEQFFARCTRPNGPVRGTCIHERSLDAAEITLRFPREWLEDWRGLAAGFDRLLAQLHP
ncbi:MAG TPA: hypothetical protein VNY79_03865 [Xanthobacteraceae bacterium]|nr:hypothetical protein [Xanthobacteraceae bacterium]